MAWMSSGDGEDVLVEHAEVGQLARLERAFAPLHVVLPGAAHRVEPDASRAVMRCSGPRTVPDALDFLSTAASMPCSQSGR